MITKKNNLYYENGIELVDIPRVSTILKGETNFFSNAMAIGTDVHDLVSQVFENPSLVNSSFFLELEKNNPVVWSKTMIFSSNLARYLNKIKDSLGEIKGYGIEVSFKTETQVGSYVGTCDYLIELDDGTKYVIDLKTGKREDWHQEQIVAYKLGLGADYCCIIYENDFFELAEEEEVFAESLFLEKLKAYYEGNLKNGRIFAEPGLEANELADILVFAKKQINTYTELLNKTKDSLAVLTAGNNFENDKILGYWKKESDSYSLKKEAKDQLFEAMPHLFEKKTSQPIFVVRLKNEKN